MSDRPKGMLPSELVRVYSVRHKKGPFFTWFVEVWTGVGYETLCELGVDDGDGTKYIDILNRMIEQGRSET